MFESQEYDVDSSVQKVLQEMCVQLCIIFNLSYLKKKSLVVCVQHKGGSDIRTYPDL